jgi:hypothetical protein
MFFGNMKLPIRIAKIMLKDRTELLCKPSSLVHCYYTLEV